MVSSERVTFAKSDDNLRTINVSGPLSGSPGPLGGLLEAPRGAQEAALRLQEEHSNPWAFGCLLDAQEDPRDPWHEPNVY